MVSLKRAHFPQEIILTCVQRYVAYPLSTRRVEELMQERGASVHHATINRWVVKYSPQREVVFHRHKRPMWLNWRNIVGQDHRAVKQITRPMLGFKSFTAASPVWPPRLMGLTPPVTCTPGRASARDPGRGAPPPPPAAG